jgi:nucleotide-binding universal stress UspA family protein
VQTKEPYFLEENDRQSPPVLPADDSKNLDANTGCLPGTAEMSSRILVYLSGTGADLEIRAYGEYLSNLLQGQITYLFASSGDDYANLTRAARHFDLLLFGEPEQSTIKRVLFGSIGRRISSRTPATILVAQQPCWPIQNILLVIRVEAAEELSIDWAGRLACASGAHLTILPLVPFQPPIYSSESHLRAGFESLLAPNTPSGEQLRTFLNRLNKWQVNGSLHVRQGDPLWQIYGELDEGKYDLVVIGAEHRSRRRRWLFGELAGPLVSCLKRPILIAGTSRPGNLRPDHE